LQLLIHSIAFNVILFFLKVTLIFSILQNDRNPGQRDGTYFNFEEVTRLVELKLTLIDPREIPNYYMLDRFPDSPDKHYPTLYFTGSSWGIPGNEVTVIGSVTMSERGVVRWRLVSPVIVIISTRCETEMI
jgi:hypothetical protein